MRFLQYFDKFTCGPHKRWVLLPTAILSVLWISGYYYGFNALIVLYKDLGVFAYLCEGNETVSHVAGCAEQEKMFGYASVVWLVIQTIAAAFVGLAMDKIGLRLVKLIATLVYTLGTLMMAFTEANTSWMLFPAGILVSVGCTSSFVCDLQISSMFRRGKGFVISILSGAFDSSTLITFVLTKTVPDVFSLKTSLIIMAVCALVVGTLIGLFGYTQWAVDMENQLAQTGDEVEYFVESLDKTELTNQESEYDARIQAILDKKYPSIRDCLCSMPFALLTLWFMFGLLRFFYFLNQMGQQLNYMFKDDEETIQELRSISSALLMCGIIFSPISGIVLEASQSYFRKRIEARLREHGDTLSDDELYNIHITAIAPAFLVMASAALLSALLYFSHTKAAFYAAVIILSISRSLLFSGSIAFVLLAFPLRNFGTVNGGANMIAGIFSLIQYGLMELPPLYGNGVTVAIALVLFISPLVLLLKRKI